MKDQANGSDEHCLYKNVARVLAEEPQLEAVAFEPEQKLAIATLGDDAGQRIAGRVSDAVADSDAQCGVLNDRGLCAQCGEAPVRKVGDANVVVKNVLGSTVIEKLTCRTAVGFWRWNTLRWPRLVSCRDASCGAGDRTEWKTLAALSAACLVFGFAGWLAEKFGAGTLGLALFFISYVAGARDAAQESSQRLRNAELDIHFLMLAVAIGAACIGAWQEGALLLFLFSASGAMEHYAAARTRGEIDALLRGAPKTATVIENGAEVERAVESLASGMNVRVRAGEQVPVDVRITQGESACDESNLTGESRPMPKQRGDHALAGTLNLWGVIDGEVLRPASESALQKIINLIERAQEMKAPSQRFTDRFGTGYTYAVLGACALFFLVGWLALGWPAFLHVPHAPSAFYRAMTLLVVMSPCALVLSVPSAILSAIAAGARRGVLFRGGSAIETLADVATVALDKTGTLTHGELVLDRVETFAGDESALLTAAYNLARLSNHPLSRAIQKVGAQRNLDALGFTSVKSAAGRGIEGRLRGQLYRLGSREMMRETEVACVCENAPPAEHDMAEVWVSGPGICGRMLFRDELRAAAREMLDSLRRAGIRTVMLTGDRAPSAQRIAQLAGVDEVKAELSPDEKVRAVQELKRGRTKVAMIGDGVNDAPSLAAADVSVAMGARASDAALEQSDIVLMNDRLENFIAAFELSRRAKKIINQNIGIALGTVIVMALFAVIRGMPLGLGVLGHEGSTVIVVLNSLRLLLSR